jgi:L-cysteine S-thiosulfotransferase
MKARSAIHLASAALALALLTFASLPGNAADAVDPAADAKVFKKFFTDKFPKLKLEDFVNGPYSMNEDLHKQLEEKEQFPPYEFSLEAGKEMFSKPFKNGKSYEDCFPNKGIGVRQNYPYLTRKKARWSRWSWR